MDGDMDKTNTHKITSRISLEFIPNSPVKLFVQFISSVMGSIVLGIIGLWVGATIGGNFGFPEFGGNTGYEAGGVFFAIVGISLGSLLGIINAKKRQKKQYKYSVASMIAVVVMVITGVILFDYNLPPVNGLTILFVPPIVFTIITNWQYFFKQKSTSFNE